MTPVVIDPRDPDTWPAVLVVEHMAQIYPRTVAAIRRALCPNSGQVFTPRPFRKHPYQWRKADVVRDTRIHQVSRAHSGVEA